ncbi:MAG TPA: glycoside hydrolase family 6 protein, partial [Polyangia bacterium]
MRRTGPFNGSTSLAVAVTAGALTACALTGCANVSGEARQAELSPVVPPTTPPAPDGVNPFAGARLYVNPDYVKAVQGLEAAHANEAALLKRMESLPTAIWLSWIADTKEVPRYLDDALQQQKSGGQPVVSLFVVYDLPGRDCAAESSAGELSADAAGEASYQHAFIDVIAAAFRAHPEQRIAVVLEPDSLSNLVTNLER